MLLLLFAETQVNRVGERVSVFNRVSVYSLNWICMFLTLLFLLQAPSSLLEALEQHLASLEGKKTKELSADNRYEILQF